MKALIVGCGYVGTALGEELAKSGHEVWGLRRDPVALRLLETTRIKPFQADLLQTESLKALPAAEVVVLCQAPSRKKDSYYSTYFEGTKNLLQALPKKTCRKIILISSSSVYSTRDGSWVDEATDPLFQNHADRETQENAKILLESERLVLSSGFPAVVLRLSGIYGPERNRIKSVLTGRVKPVFSDLYMNRIYVTDIVRAIRLLLERGQPGEIYLGSDDAPCTQREFYTWVFEKMSWPLPANGSANESPVPAQGSNKRCSNRKIKALGLKWRYPTFREGYAPLIEPLTKVPSHG